MSYIRNAFEKYLRAADYNASLNPAQIIFPVFNSQRFFGELQRIKGVYHNCQFMRFFFADTTLVGAGMGAMRHAARMQCYLPAFYIFPAHKFAIYIV